MQTVDDGSI